MVHLVRLGVKIFHEKRPRAFQVGNIYRNVVNLHTALHLNSTTKISNKAQTHKPHARKNQTSHTIKDDLSEGKRMPIALSKAVFCPTKDDLSQIP
jgi:hypothetical protein